jgi:photosystem II stability/assembly factor-like uncharacterized protein
MEEAGLEPEISDPFLPARARRALALIAVSMLAIAIAGIAYVRPNIGIGDAEPAPVLHSTYSVSAVDFVDQFTGWVVATFDNGDYAVLHTTDGGLSWTRQTAGAGQGHPVYLKFFDTAVGIVGLVGTTPRLYRTADGGKTWSGVAVTGVGGTVLSWSFVDSYFGWVLVSSASTATYLYRTVDGGLSWTNLGTPAPPPDQVFQVSFSYLTTGWLSSANGGAYAYKTSDYGDSWTRVPLPAPGGGWPSGGRFMVAIQPTVGVGVAASVVFFPTQLGRKGTGATIADFPPLTVRTFDGGVPVTYTYTTAIDMKNTGGNTQQATPPNQHELRTLDNGLTWASISLPASGAIGYSDAANWWWIGGRTQAYSRDGGATWTDPRNIDALDPVPGSLQVLSPTHAWFAASDGSHPVLEATSDGGAHWRVVALPAIPDLPTP